MQRKEAELFKALGVQSRLRIIDLLKKKGPLGVSELAETMGMTPSAVSQHLKLLRFAGLVHCERKGCCMPYEVDPAALEECKELLSDVCTCGCKGTGRAHEPEGESDENSLSLLKEYEDQLKKELQKVQARIKEMEA